MKNGQDHYVIEMAPYMSMAKDAHNYPFGYRMNWRWQTARENANI